MVKVENLSKSFSNQILFEDASFQINPRERIGLVGRNGHGKTTLFRILVGEEQPSTGTITISRNYRIGYVRQHLDFTKETVLQEGMRGLREEDHHKHWKVEKILAGLGFSPEDIQQQIVEVGTMKGPDRAVSTQGLPNFDAIRRLGNLERLRQVNPYLAEEIANMPGTEAYLIGAGKFASDISEGTQRILGVLDQEGAAKDEAIAEDKKEEKA